MQFNIEVIQVEEKKNQKNSRGGVYNAVNVAYKKDGKVEGKNFPDWANKDIYPQLLALNNGQTYTVTIEKVDGYWKWLTIEKTSDSPTEGAVSSSASSTVPSNSGASKAGPGKVLGSNYETKEERAVKQVLIVRQSSLSSAIAFVAGTSPKGKPDMAVDGIINIAKQFENYVFGKTDSQPASDPFADMADDIPQ